MKEFFKMMGFEDTEDLVRNGGSMRTPEVPEIQPQNEQHYEPSQISDNAYWMATFEGVI